MTTTLMHERPQATSDADERPGASPRRLRLTNVLTHLVLGVALVIFAFPFYWLVVMATRTDLGDVHTAAAADPGR